MTAQPAQLRVPASSLGTLSKLESGGQGTVYDLSGETPALSALPYSDLVYKEYDQSARVELDSDALDDMARYAAQLTPGREGLGNRLAWPLATVEQEGTVSGFLMRRASQQFVVRLHLLNTEKQKLAEAQLLLNDEQYLANRLLPVHDRWRLQFLRDTADTLAQLHRYGIAVGDLSPKNLLTSFSTRPYCFFLDCDTMRMIGRSALPQVDTPVGRPTRARNGPPPQVTRTNSRCSPSGSSPVTRIRRTPPRCQPCTHRSVSWPSEGSLRTPRSGRHRLTGSRHWTPRPPLRRPRYPGNRSEVGSAAPRRREVRPSPRRGWRVRIEPRLVLRPQYPRHGYKHQRRITAGYSGSH